MTDDKILIVKEFPYRPPAFRIYPVGDVHLGSIGCKEKEWAEFCKHFADDPYAYIFVLGDMLDNTTKDSVGEVYANKYSPSQAKKDDG